MRCLSERRSAADKMHTDGRCHKYGCCEKVTSYCRVNSFFSLIEVTSDFKKCIDRWSGLAGTNVWRSFLFAAAAAVSISYSTSLSVASCSTCCFLPKYRTPPPSMLVAMMYRHVSICRHIHDTHAYISVGCCLIPSSNMPLFGKKFFGLLTYLAANRKGCFCCFWPNHFGWRCLHYMSSSEVFQNHIQWILYNSRCIRYQNFLSSLYQYRPQNIHRFF